MVKKSLKIEKVGPFCLGLVKWGINIAVIESLEIEEYEYNR